MRPRHRLHVCVVGYGTAGRLHAGILAELGAAINVVDPRHHDVPKAYARFTQEVRDLRSGFPSKIDVWSICCPTSEHLPVLSAILARDPRARVVVEKPACQGHEIDELAALIASCRGARVSLMDQYRDARALPMLAELVADLEPGHPIDQIAITFTKDRTPDIERGRFIDRCYGVLGYEWLHMLAVLRHLVPATGMDRYLRCDPRLSELWATYDPRLFVAALTERTVLDVGSDSRTAVQLVSSIIGSQTLRGAAPRAVASWTRAIRPRGDDRRRHVSALAGDTRFSLHLDPVTAPEGWHLDRNRHRITAERRGQVLVDEVVEDSPMHTAIRRSISELLASDEPLAPDLLPLRRIAAIAELLRAQQPASAINAAQARIA